MSAVDVRSGDFVWSANDDEFGNRDFAEVLDALYGDDELTVGRIVYYGERHTRDAAYFMPDADHILDQAGDSAYDWGGEWAEDFGRDVPAEAKKELESLLAAWANKHLKVTFYQVENVKQYVLTEEDVASMQEDA